MKDLNIFVDESGDFGDYSPHSPYYIVTLVLHDQTVDITKDIYRLNKIFRDSEWPVSPIHTGPLKGGGLITARLSNSRKESQTMYYVYPALFKENPNGGYIVTVPDAPGCVTGGKTLKEALFMIKDALSVYMCSMEDHKETIPSASNPKDIIIDEPGYFTTLIEVDTIRYRTETNNKSIRKNVSLPAWLNAQAEKARINCSQVLQEALRERLNL